MKARVILVEDDPGIRKALSLLLKSNGYEVLTAADPTLCPIYTSADATCFHEDPCGDFLITDNQMPHMSGLDFVAEQGQRGCKGVMANKAIMSGSWSSEQLRRAEELGCKVFHKPFSPDELLSWLEERSKHLLPDRKLANLSG